MDGQSWSLKINFKTSLISPFFGGNKNLGQFESVLRNGIPSFDSAPIFKMLKQLGNKNYLLTFSSMLHGPSQSFLSSWAIHKKSYN